MKVYTTRKKSGTSEIGKGKGKAVPLQARSGPEGSRKLRFPDFVTTAQDGGKQCFSLHKDTTPPQPNHTVTPTHIEPEQYNT